MNRLSTILLAALVLGSAAASITSAPAFGAEADKPIDAQGIAAVVDPLVVADLARTGAPGAAFVFVDRGKLVYARGYGVSRLGGSNVDVNQTVWPIASITKTVTALALLQLVDAGKVSLDVDVNIYLRRWKVPASRFGPVTLRQLLSHTAGLDELPGRQVDGSKRPDLAGFLAGKFVRYRRPGELTAYSTYGIMLAAVVLEDVTGRRYDDYVRDEVFRPAGMTRARIMSVRGDERGVATPYILDDGRAKPIPFEFYASTPASSGVASATDMGRLLMAHLQQGKTRRPILSATTLALMHRTQATNHSALPGWSLGMQMDQVNGVRIAEHGGDIGGFSALFAVMPDRRQGFFIVSHGESTDLRFRVRDALVRSLTTPVAIPKLPSSRPEDVPRLRQYAGRYLSSLSCRSCARRDADIFDLKVTPDGALDFWGQRWVPAGQDLFVGEDGARRLGFARDASSRIVSVSGGSWRVADRLEP